MVQKPPPVSFTLDKESELRFEVEDRLKKLSLELIDGFAEVFGAELVKTRRYEFGYGAKVAVFSWQGCSLSLSYRPKVCYAARGTPMPVYLNCHGALENMRRTAEAQGKRGPVALVAGPPDVGKSSLCQTLLNYAAKIGRQPLYVDLNPDLGHVSVPGTVCALPIERPALVPEGFLRLRPLVLHYGHYSPDGNAGHFNALVAALAERSFTRMQRCKNSAHKYAGIVIDTCGACKDTAYGTLLYAAQAFEVDVVLVIDNEKLWDQLTRDLPQFVKVVLMPKSGGVVERSLAQRLEAREQAIRDYFYGRAVSLAPQTQEMKFEALKLYASFPEVPLSCMPAGMQIDLSRKVSPVKFTAELLHRLLALSYAEAADESAPLASVMGFLCVTSVDLERRLITVLQPRPMPANHLLFLSQVQFFDSI